MDTGENKHSFSKEQDSDVVKPSLFEVISSKNVAGFDTIEEVNENSSHGSHSFRPIARETEMTMQQMEDGSSPPNDSGRHHRTVSISMPASPAGHHSQPPKTVFFNDHPKGLPSTPLPRASTTTDGTAAYFSQPMPKGMAYPDAAYGRSITTAYPEAAYGRSITASPDQQFQNPQVDRLKTNRFNSFKTWSGKLERQLTMLGGRPVESQPEDRPPRMNESDGALPVHRYFDALGGPELDTLRPSEELMLPDDETWPFLLRFPVASFGICLGVSSQAILWKTLATSSSTIFMHISPIANMVLWLISIALLVTVSCIYMLKVIFYFEAVRREYYHPIRVNFFFAPFIAILFLLLGIPPSIATKLHQSLWYIFMTPFLCLELKIYGQWMSGGQRRLSKVANPSNHLSVVGNFVGALLGASMGLKEGPLFFFAVGLAHYTVLFVTLYQRLPTNETLPKELHPVFFLFVAAPSVASMAWSKIQGSFDYGSRIAYFIALFLYFSLAVRLNFFRGFRFSLAWWAYTFPMTGAAIATIRYSNEVTTWVTQTLAVVLSLISTLVVTALLVKTLLNAFVFRNLFPNDIAIAISDVPPKHHLGWFDHLRHGNSDSHDDIERYFRYAHSGGKDMEASQEPPTKTPQAYF